MNKKSCFEQFAINIPILYVWLTREESQKFNLMLAASGSFVTTEKELRHALHHWLYEGKFNCEYGVDDDLVE